MFAQQTVEFDTFGFSAGKDFDTLATSTPWAFGGWSKGGINQPPCGAVKVVGMAGLGQDDGSMTIAGADFPTWAVALGAGTLLYLMFSGVGGSQYSLADDFKRALGVRTTVYRKRRKR
jgi:hypothetical protein